VDILDVAFMRAEAIADQSAYRRNTPSWERVRALAARHLCDMSADALEWQIIRLRAEFANWEQDVGLPNVRSEMPNLRGETLNGP
jgi:hypothetical protein